jgi:hypothetical protein
MTEWDVLIAGNGGHLLDDSVIPIYGRGPVNVAAACRIHSQAQQLHAVGGHRTLHS